MTPNSKAVKSYLLVEFLIAPNIKKSVLSSRTVIQSLMSKAAVLSERKPPRSSADSTTVDVNAGANVAATDASRPEKTHDVCFRRLCCKLRGRFVSAA